jgi:acyl carrier protein
MGLDLLDLTFRVEKEFRIKLSKERVLSLAKDSSAPGTLEQPQMDIQVDDFVSLVQATIEEQRVGPGSNVYNRVKKHVAQCLDVEESEISPESWFVRDLGME